MTDVKATQGGGTLNCTVLNGVSRLDGMPHTYVTRAPAGASLLLLEQPLMLLKVCFARAVIVWLRATGDAPILKQQKVKVHVLIDVALPALVRVRPST